MKSLKLAPVLIAAFLAAPSFAQVNLGGGAGATVGSAPPVSATTSMQRDVNQQTRIESGLQSGALTTHEAAKLESETARVNHVEANAMKDGTVTAAERARINAAQNKVSSDIHAEKHDAQTGNPSSASSLRMQSDVQRNVNQETRIANGVKNGSLTTKETARLKRGQAHVSRKEARAGRNGSVTAREQASVQVAENRQSRHIHRQKHD